jgi:lysophospholipase L1-like esterase
LSAAPVAQEPEAKALAAEPAAVPAFVTSNSQLQHFQKSLYDLSIGKRKTPSRILWLGDSHGQADFWSGRVRRLLGDAFGDGGPGFLHLGYKNYRHDDVRFEIEGKWRMRPKKPVGVKRQADGVFGLGGLMMGGYKDSPRVDLKLGARWRPQAVSFDLCYRLHDAADRVEVQDLATPNSKPLTVPKGKSETVLHHTWRTNVDWTLQDGVKEPALLRVTPFGKAELCGLVVEAVDEAKPGIVLDTLAINGARYGTMLAWDEAAWVNEAARREPQLVILELGTNEAGDLNPPVTKIEKQVSELVARVRKANPEVDCLVVSPTDRADAEEGVAQVREATRKGAEAAGCAYLDVWTLLGGKGAFSRLREEQTPKVQKDGIHLTIRGYQELGPPMVEELLRGFEPVRAKP